MSPHDLGDGLAHTHFLAGRRRAGAGRWALDGKPAHGFRRGFIRPLMVWPAGGGDAGIVSDSVPPRSAKII
jgi:hypothetical protein